MTFKDVLMKMREMLDTKGYSQIPQLSASRDIDVDTKFDITPDDFSGTKRAVLIGINYVGQVITRWQYLSILLNGNSISLLLF